MSIRVSALRFLPVLIVLAAVFAAPVPVAANEKYAGIVVDGKSGKTLYANDADARRYPASLTKMMTLYIVFEELQAKRLSLNTRLSVSAHAAGQAPSKLGLRAGSTIKVEEAILALVTKSANDVAVVVAENLGGSVRDFAARMNRTARALGMHSTTFRNPHGLPDNGQYTTARDLVLLARGLQDRFPTYYKYFGTRSFTFRGTRYGNHNRLLGSVEGVDGIKTGYIRASGFNLVTNVRRDGRHIIAVVMGGRTGASRDAQMRKLIAEYLPKASRGERSLPPLIADTGPHAPIAVALARLPRARPAIEPDPVMAYAGSAAPRDLVAAALAQSAAQPAARPEADEPVDQIAARINGASEVAALALASFESDAGEDPIARLTQIAQMRAGAGEIVAGAPVAASERSPDPESGEAGWHIQIGAVPTAQGAQALIERAKSSFGPVLASLQPVTQEVERNGTTLYRARFAGFAGKDEARATCAKLKSQSFACLAVPN